MGNTMKEAHIHADTSVTLHDADVPQVENPHHIIVKVIVAGCNPKDWKMPAGLLRTISDCPNSGDDIAGYVHAVGNAVTGFAIGDRVAALHQLGHKYGCYAEYAQVWDHATFHLPRGIGFEAAATLPMGTLMAGVGLYAMLKVSTTLWEPLQEPRPLVIYGAAGTVGAYAVKLAMASNIHPLICVAGNSGEFVKSLIDPSKGDVVLDYREGNDALVNGMREALHGLKLQYAFDGVSQHGSWENICQVLDHATGSLTLVLPHHQSDVPSSVNQSLTMVGSLWPGFHRPDDLRRLGLEQGGPDFGAVMTTLIARWLAEGKLEPHPYEVVPNGLEGVETALRNLRNGKASAKKYVVRIAETPGL